MLVRGFPYHFKAGLAVGRRQPGKLIDRHSFRAEHCAVRRRRISVEGVK
jgi:hypothetical protein